VVEIPVRSTRNGVAAPGIYPADYDDVSSGDISEGEEDVNEEDEGQGVFDGHENDDDEEDVRDAAHVSPLLEFDYLDDGDEHQLEHDEEDEGPRVKVEEEDGVEDGHGHGVGYEVLDEETLVRRAVVRRRVLGEGGE
jgi:hypothetical protein